MSVFFFFFFFHLPIISSNRLFRGPIKSQLNCAMIFAARRKSHILFRVYTGSSLPFLKVSVFTIISTLTMATTTKRRQRNIHGALRVFVTYKSARAFGNNHMHYMQNSKQLLTYWVASMALSRCSTCSTRVTIWDLYTTFPQLVPFPMICSSMMKRLFQFGVWLIDWTL